MTIQIRSRNASKWVDVNITVDGIKHELGLMSESQAKDIVNELQEGIDEICQDIQNNQFFEGF